MSEGSRDGTSTHMSQFTTPDQLGDWVESLLSQVETRLDERNKQVAARSTSR